MKKELPGVRPVPTPKKEARDLDRDEPPWRRRGFAWRKGLTR
jgi:hypothetical protein